MNYRNIHSCTLIGNISQGTEVITKLFSWTLFRTDMKKRLCNTKRDKNSSYPNDPKKILKNSKNVY